MSKPVKIEVGTEVKPQIYAYTLNSSEFSGQTKIGYTERDVEVRIHEQVSIFGFKHNTEWHEDAFFNDGTSFTDKDFHTYLEKECDVKKRERTTEWFYISGPESHLRFKEFVGNKGILESLPERKYVLRKEQEEAVETTTNYFNSMGSGTEFLWNAKPRFGKTLSAYDLCKKLNLKKVLILTNRPSIANSWYSDYIKFLGTKSGYYFVSEINELKDKKNVYTREQYEKDIRKTSVAVEKIGLIEFVSLQDLKGSTYFGGVFDKLKEIRDQDWDLVIIDEAHEGVDTFKSDHALERIKRKYTLHLSGTPFKALANDKFKQEAIFNWTYYDEQKAKSERKSSNNEENNPYEVLPQLSMFTYKMSDIVREKVRQGEDFDKDGENEDYYWDLNEFFKTNIDGKFIHDKSVNKFLDALTDQEKFPFYTDELRKQLKHTLWILKYVSSAKALAKKLKEHKVFGNGSYKIVLAAGDGKLNDEGESDDLAIYNERVKTSYQEVKQAIEKYQKTITISVGQLTTGITIPEWSGVLMLSNMKSASLYIQAAFRVQNPCLYNEEGKHIRKKNAYVFDFDPTRTLKIFEEYANDLNVSTSLGKGSTEERKTNIRNLLNFFPIYGEDDEGKMVQLDEFQVLDIPRKIISKEVVKKGFMSNFLLKNIENIFHAPKEIIDAINGLNTQKIKPTNITEETKKELSINNEGDVEVSDSVIIGIENEIFGTPIAEDEDKKQTNDVIDNSNNDEINALVNGILEQLDSKTKTLVNKAEEANYFDNKKVKPNKVIKQINNENRKNVENAFREYQARAQHLENEKKIKVEEAGNDSNLIDKIKREYNEKVDKENEDLKGKICELSESISRKIIEFTEESERNSERNQRLDGIRDHLRGFARTIPSFLMAYGDENTTLANFDAIIPEEVFKEITNISLSDFRILRDGFDDKDENGTMIHYEGFFDETIFNASVKEFLSKRKELANYFEDDVKEDIFDYIPPQKTNQIFTPKKVVIQMVDKLEEENPGCFDDPNHTFIDLYMKSGLYIAEIVKRLYRSEKLKEIYPNKEERLAHIFEKQVYGIAPTEIIYEIATNYLLGFSDEVNIAKRNFKLCKDVVELAKEGKLESRLDEIFSDN